MNRTPKDKPIKLQRASVLIVEGPGAEWTLLLRGVLEKAPEPAAGKRPRPRVRRKEGNA